MGDRGNDECSRLSSASTAHGAGAEDGAGGNRFGQPVRHGDKDTDLEMTVKLDAEVCDLSRSTLGDSGASSVGRVLQSEKGFACKTVLLARNVISPEGARQLSNMLGINESLTSLSLYKNKIGDDGILWLSQALLGNRTLSTLNVRDNVISSEGACGLANIMTRLRGDCPLRLLNISDNAIGPKGCSPLVRTGSKMHTLNIGGCGFGPADIHSLRSALESPSSRSLTSLKLNDNGITDGVAVSLARALASNNTLRILDLSGNCIEAAGAKQLAEMRRGNTVLESLNMQAGKCPCGRKQGVAALSGGRFSGDYR